MLYIGERVGRLDQADVAAAVDIAVDPLEGTNLVATGQGGAITVLAASERGGLRDADHLEGQQALHRRVLLARGRGGVPQWRKWRRPVKTIARWCRSATSIAISSRREPPGWMIAVTPAIAAWAMASGNGK